MRRWVGLGVVYSLPASNTLAGVACVVVAMPSGLAAVGVTLAGTARVCLLCSRRRRRSRGYQTITKADYTPMYVPTAHLNPEVGHRGMWREGRVCREESARGVRSDEAVA